MINATEEFIKQLNKGAVCVNYADITLANGTVLNLDYKDFMANGNSIVDKTSTGKFSIGSVIGKTCTLNIANHKDQFSDYDFYQATVYLYVALQLEDGSIEKIKKGKYYITEPATSGEIITIKGVDSMCLFDKEYETELGLPTTLKNIVFDACLHCGVMIPNNFDFDNSDMTVHKQPSGVTYRQVLSLVAQAACTFFRIDENDYITSAFFPEYSESQKSIIDGNYYNKENENTINGGDFENYSDDILDGGNFTDYTDDDGFLHFTKIKNLNVSTDDVQITGVVITDSNKNEWSVGTKDYAIQISNNVFAIDNEEFLCDYIFNKIKNYKFRPLSADIPNNPLLEPYEIAFVHDRKGNEYLTLINSVTYKTSGYTSIQCLAEDPIKNGSHYISKSASEIIQMRRETNEKFDVYSKAVQNMNMLAANSMGVFTSEEVLEDGSTIYYMHNKPNRSQSKTIYKMTQDGFFVSNNYGVTYSAGFDSQGNAILNILSVIGITFDWAKGGVLSIGGLNNTNGQIYIYDSIGSLCGVINNAGISIYSAINQKQIIISPTLGFVTRDSTDGTFEGQIADITTHFDPIYDAPDNKTRSYSYEYEYEHKDKIAVYNTGQSKPDESGTLMLYLYRYYYKHVSEGWSDKYNYVEKKKNYSVTVQLPNNFKFKNFSVTVTVKPNNDRIKNRKNEFVKEYIYPESVIYEKADGTTWDQWTLLSMDATDKNGNLLYPAPAEVTDYEGTKKIIEAQPSIYVPDDALSMYNGDREWEYEALPNTYTVTKNILTGTVTIKCTSAIPYLDIHDLRIIAMY